MAWETAQYKLTSSCPLIQHNGRMANPLDKWAKLIKAISSKRAKTDADYEEMAHLEFLAGLYMGPDGPVLPAYMLDAVLVAGAKKSKQGQVAKSGVFCTEHARLEYDGPRTAEELWADDRFRFAAIVRVQNARVSRMRPRFEQWQAVITLKYDPNTVNVTQIDTWLVVAGAQIGLGDWRPQHGRFGRNAFTRTGWHRSHPGQKTRCWCPGAVRFRPPCLAPMGLAVWRGEVW